MKERYHVTGMTCSACSSHVEKAVSKLDGMGKASVNLLTETMDVIYDEKSLTQADIVAAVVKAGYGAQLMEEMGQQPIKALSIRVLQAHRKRRGPGRKL